MAQKKAKIILDTNVLYAGLYSSKGASFRVLQAIEEGKLTMVISTTLLFEYEDLLKRNQAVLGLSIQEIESLLDYFCMRSEHQKIYFLWRLLLRDPKDDHLLGNRRWAEGKLVFSVCLIIWSDNGKKSRRQLIGFVALIALIAFIKAGQRL